MNDTLKDNQTISFWDPKKESNSPILDLMFALKSFNLEIVKILERKQYCFQSYHFLAPLYLSVGSLFNLPDPSMLFNK